LGKELRFKGKDTYAWMMHVVEMIKRVMTFGSYCLGYGY
jgi:hypothetical protein